MTSATTVSGPPDVSDLDQCPENPPSPHAHEPVTVRRQAGIVRILDLAERITTLVEAGVWTRTTLPSQEEVQRRLSAGRETIVEVFKLLVSRNVLRQYYDPKIHRRPRYLPAHDAEHHEVTSRVDEIAEEIEANIWKGTWNSRSFPDCVEMGKRLRCRTDTIAKAMQRVQDRGLVRRVKDGWTWRWMPIGHPAWNEPPLYERVLLDILSGRWTGPLPSCEKLADIYGTGSTSIRRLCSQLAEVNLVRDIRKPGRKHAVWAVTDDDTAYNSVDDQAAAIAADIAATIPGLLEIGPHGVVSRRHQLPTPAHLAETYHCNEWTIHVAIALLTRQRLIEPDCFDPTRYVPVWTSTGALRTGTRGPAGSTMQHSDDDH